MSDSDCSNCPEKSCKYYDYSYDCWKKKVEEVQQHVTLKDINDLKLISIKLNKLYEETYIEEINNTKENIENIIHMFKGE